MAVTIGPARPSGATTEAPPGGFPLRRSDLLLILAFWTFMAVLTAANRVLDPRGPSLQPAVASAPVALAFIESYLWAILTVPIFWMGSRFNVERGNRALRILLFVAIGVVVAVFVDVTTDALRAELFDFSRRRGLAVGTLRSLTRLWFLNDFIVYVAVFAAALARDYSLRYRTRRDEAVRLEAQAAHLQAQLAEARLAVLRTQLNPHFLFNTLHAVSALVERDPRGVRRMIARLSELLRYTLEGTTEQEIALHEELELIRRYLEIIQIRFQGRLEVTMEIDPDVEDALVPNLILQPLVENAIKHGVSKVEGVGKLHVGAHRSGDSISLSVRDNGPNAAGQTATQAMDAVSGSTGVGLRNTRARLEQLYGHDQSFALRPADEGGMIAEIQLPYHTRADLHTAGVPATV